MKEATTKEQKLERFGPGLWVDEPDRIEWRAHGLPCLIQRNYSFGNLCGYVGVPPGHPAHGKGIDTPDADLDVHGGVTYASACNGHICHVPAPGEPDDVWWLGFDCGHAWDLAPHDAKHSPGLYVGEQSGMLPRPQYRDIAFVRVQCEQLAEQLSKHRSDVR